MKKDIKEHAELKRRARRSRTFAMSLPKDEPYHIHHSVMADCLEKAATDLIKVDEPREIGPGGEVLPAYEEIKDNDEMRMIGRDTLKQPSQINQEASISRIDLIAEAGVYESAIDASESINARNSLEKMLAHQMALAHEMSFKLSQMAMKQNDPVETARLSNATARQMDTYQKAFLTLQKIRSGGKQEIVVQHVKVEDGAKAVITGKMQTGGHNSGGEIKNGN